jgi:hypothetical protein
MRRLRPYKFSILRLRFAQWALSLSHVGASFKSPFSPLLALGYGVFGDIHYNLASTVL